MKDKFTDWIENYPEDYGICPPPLDAQKALNFLHDYLLGEDYYFTMPMSVEQCNTELVHLILINYSKEYRKECKLKEKEKKKGKK